MTVLYRPLTTLTCRGDEVLCNGDDIAAEVEKITGGKGAYGAIDCVAGDLTGRMLAAVRPAGQIIVYGAMAGFSTTMNVGDLLFKQKVGTGPRSYFFTLCICIAVQCACHQGCVVRVLTARVCTAQAADALLS